MAEHFFGWDIGGAHLKVARLDAHGRIVDVRQVACPLWRGVGELARSCALLGYPLTAPSALHAVTMTGELCDSFPDRTTGVRAILERFASLVSSTAEIRVFAGYRGWVDAAGANAAAADIASANWLALGALVAESVADATLMDVGSTTTDIIPISDNDVVADGRDDESRLRCGELVYSGVIRTPVFGICDAVPFRGAMQPLCAEVFATASDVYRLLGAIREEHDLMPAADNGSKDRVGSARRLARALGHDFVDDELTDLLAVAASIAAEHRHLLGRALARIWSRAPGAPCGACLVGAGVGRFLVAELARDRDVTYRDFSDLVGAPEELADTVAVAAPAVAAARLAWLTR